MSLYVCGDTHGDYDIHKLTSRNFDCLNLTKNDYVLICGDCGVVWDLGKSDAYIQKWYNRKPWTTLFIDGNHENYAALDNLPLAKWQGGNVHFISDSIIHLMRGQIYNIDGHKVFSMGGASSHDKIYRTENVSWWARELPSYEEFDTALKNLEAHNNEVEYIFSHCAGGQIQSKINERYENNSLTAFLDEIEKVEFKHWYFGHYHIDADIDGKHTALYENVIKLW